MKVYKKKYAHRNLLLFLVFSVVYLAIVFAFSKGQTVLSRETIISFSLKNIIVLMLLPFVFYSVFTYKKYAKYLLYIFLSIIVVSSFILFSASFNKLILALNFAYALYAFFFYTMWEVERDEAGYNPSFSHNDLEKQSRFPIHGIVYSGNRSSYINVRLTNIDDYSCFVLLDNQNIKMEPATLEVRFDNVVFSSKVIPVSRYDNGVGFNFADGLASPWSLTELCKICRERGFFLD